MSTQAEIVISKFGKAGRLAKLLRVDRATVCRWTYPRANGGTDGMIPPKALRRVLELARSLNINITPADLYPAASSEGKA